VANRPSTRARDEGYLERYLLPAFGSTPLGQIDPAAVRVLVAELLAQGLSAATVTKAGQILSKIMDDAVADKRINANPCKGIKLPRDPNPPEMLTIGPPAIAQLADAIDERYRVLVLLGCYGGLRIGELLGLTVAEVDPLRRVVNVKRTLVEVEGHLHVHAPKTRAGRRSVPIPAAVAEELAAYMIDKHADDILFPAPKGGYVRLAAWRQRIWRPATEAVGLGGFRIHDMRHSAISMWVASGADPRKVATWAGHASVVTVLDRYAHVTPVADDPAIAVLDQLARQAQAAHSGPTVIRPIR
jgi:integrase